MRARLPLLVEISRRDLFAAVTLGLAGFLLNGWALDLGWGAHLLLGSAVALVGLRLLPPLPAALAVSIAAVETIVRWSHPWAWVIWSLEGALLALTVRRVSPIKVDFAFWLLAGGPLLFLTYGGILGLKGTSLWLVIAKQSLNGLLNIWLAEALYLGLLLVPKAARWLRLLPMPAPSFVMVLLTAIALLPPPFYLALDASRQEDLILSTTRAAARREMSEVQGTVRAWFDNRSVALQVIAADALHDGQFDVAVSRLGPLIGDFDRIAVYSDGRRLAHFPPDQPPPQPTASPALQADGNAWQIRPVFEGGSNVVAFIEFTVTVPDSEVTIFARLPRERIVEIYRSYSASPGSAIAIVSAHGAVITTIGAIERIGFVLDLLRRSGRDLLPTLVEPRVLATSGFGQSLMTHLQGAVLAVGVPLLGSVPGPWVVVFELLGPAIHEARAAQLQLLLLQWLFVSLSIVGAAIVSMIVGARLQELSGFVSRIVVTPQRDSSAKQERSVIQELGDIDRKVDEVGGVLQGEREEVLTFQKRLATIEAHAPIVLYEVDIAQGARVRMRWASGSFDRVLKYSQEAITAPHWWADCLHPADAPTVVERFTGLRPGQVVTSEYRFRRADGDWRWLYDVLVVSETPAENGGLRGEGFLIDVSQRKQAEQQLLQASKLASLGEMATGMAHELNQPLNVIKMGASNLQFDLEEIAGVGPDHLRQLGVIIGQVDRAAKLINHLRVFGRLPVEATAPFSLASVCDGLGSLITAQFAAQRILVTFDLQDDLPLVVGHPILLEQVMLNITMNARDSILQRRVIEPGISGCIAIKAKRSLGGVIIEIEDNGTGIPANVLSRVFEPFFTTKPAGQGTGLGLAVSYGIIREMGGTLQAFTLRQGARFVMSLSSAADDRPVRIC